MGLKQTYACSFKGARATLPALYCREESRCERSRPEGIWDIRIRLCLPAPVSGFAMAPRSVE